MAPPPAPFPFGIQPEAVSSATSDTVNRLLLHGARYHDRPSVFSCGGDGAEKNPDWRVDRHSIRIGLALAADHGVTTGTLVGLSMPFTLQSLLVERAVWGLGAVTSFASRATSPLVVDPEAARDLLERGSVLDTPERASKFRETAREVSPSRLASIELDGEERSQAAWVAGIEQFLLREPPRRGARRALGSAPPSSRLEARVVAFAGWTDGFTETVLPLE